MELAAALIAARFIHYAALTALFGAALFSILAYPRGQVAAEVRARLRPVLTVASALVLVSGVAWLALATGAMTGELRDAWSIVALQTVITEMEFGRVWCLRLALAAVALLLLLRSGSERLIAGIAALLLGSIALTGHTRVEEGSIGLVHITADAAHLLAAGAWLGGLMALAVMVRVEQSLDRGEASAFAVLLSRFSRMGYVAVAILVGSGLVNAWLLVGTLEALVSTSHGQLLLVKLALFALMLALAAANRLWISPALSAASDGEAAIPWLIRLRRHVSLEQGFGGAVLLLVSVMGTIEPAVAQVGYPAQPKQEIIEVRAPRVPSG